MFTIQQRSSTVRDESVRPAVGLILMIALISTGCASGRLNNARSEFYKGDLIQAEKHLEKPITGRDQLLYLMETALVQHQVGRIDESTANFLAAAELIERQDVISLSEQAGSLVTSEWMTEYKGEIAERLWVHTYLMMNFLISNRYESALVEGRRALKLLESHSETLADDHFTRALIGLCFEQLNEWNDAYIAYRNLAGYMKDPAPLSPFLLRLAIRLGFSEDADFHKQALPDKHTISSPDEDGGEFILFIAQGRGPQKVPGNIFIPPATRFSFPQYETRQVPRVRFDVHVNGTRITPFNVSTDIHRVASASLKARAARIMAKETARVATKEAIARSVERQDDALGLIVRLILFVLEEPDTRAWGTLPAHLTLFRIPISTGHRQVILAISNHNGETVDQWISPEIDFKPGQRVFYSLRLRDDGTVMFSE